MLVRTYKLQSNFDITNQTMPQNLPDMSSRIQQVINEFGNSPLGRTPLAKAAFDSRTGDNPCDGNGCDGQVAAYFP